MSNSTKGGSRKGSGMKKSTDISNKIKKYVNEFMENMLSDDDINNEATNQVKEILSDQGWIYIIMDNKTGLYKVGVTQRSNPKTRLSLYTSHNMNISLVFIDIIDNCFDVEGTIHGMFDRENNGDWFCLSSDELLMCIMEISNHKYKNIHNKYNQ